MSSAGLETLKEIFHSARELQPNERSTYLDRACGDDERLRCEIEALLRSHEAADGFIADPPAQLAAEAVISAEDLSDVGKTFGRYQLIERIGSGGMGTVYLARRSDQQFEMQVAIKLIKRGMDSEAVLRRFAHERQILASLEHPNIARLLDGGTTEEGLPYFVMEYIQGERIDRYAEAHQLSIRERLELFRQVCGAVSYAHQHLVVHRDLKPSNILVTADGVPKLLDFGIAKIIQPNDDAATFATMTAAAIMTPEYASPEQIEGAPATTHSDVYSLGAVLYQVLAGRPPYQLQNRSPQEVARISTAQIETPSAVVTRSDDARRLRGDVDNIVRMAMRKETARRYRSVEQFSEDIRRHLAGRPVIARPDTLSYRSTKFIQRNKVAVSAGALLLLTLVGGIVATTWQARRAAKEEQRARAEQARAERRFADVRKLANRVLFDYHDAIKALAGSTKARELLVRDALSYLDGLAGEAHDDPALQRELAAAYERVGDVRGTLGDMSGALESQTKALRIREAIVAAHPNDLEARSGLAASHRKIGTRLLDTGEGATGLDHFATSVSHYTALTREHPANDGLQLELADSHMGLGRAMGQRGDFAGAIEQQRAALAICEKLVASNPQDLRYRQRLRSSHAALGYTLNLQNDKAGAIASNTTAIEIGEALLAEHPLNADYRRGLMVTYQHRGDFLRKTDEPAALEAFRRAATLNEELVAADPANGTARKDLAYTHKRIADFLVALEDHGQALMHFGKALEGYERVVADAPTDLISSFLVVACRAGVARMQARIGEVDLAHEQCEKAVAFLRQISGDKPGFLGRAQAHEYVAQAYVALAEAAKTSAADKRERMTTAREMFQQTLNVIDEARRQQGNLGTNESWATKLAGEMAKCDAVLAQKDS